MGFALVGRIVVKFSCEVFFAALLVSSMYCAVGILSAFCWCFSSILEFLLCYPISCILLSNSNSDFPFSHGFPESTRLSGSSNCTPDPFISLSVLFRSGIQNLMFKLIWGGIEKLILVVVCPDSC